MGLVNVPLVTIDTNIYVSGTTVSSTSPRQIIHAWQVNEINIALSEPIIMEIKNVLSRPYFARKLSWNKENIDDYVENLRLTAVLVPGTTGVSICRDPKDNMVFSCALESHSDYIVSGDKDILEIKSFQNIPVKSPKELAEEVLMKN